MANIAVPNVFAPLTKIQSAQVNADFSEIQTKFNTYAVQTDVAKVITASHTWQASQNIAGDLLFTDNLYDIGKSGATRPRHGYFAGNLVAGGTITGTVLDKAGAVYNTRAYGVIGDGVADDAPALEALMLLIYNAGGGIMSAPPGTYLLGTLSAAANANATYICPRDGVSIEGAGIGRTTFKVKSGENARFYSSNAPNVLSTNQATPLKNARYSDFTVDWNGANNLLDAGATRRNNASIMSNNGGQNIIIERVQVLTTPGDQCIFFPATANLGQRNILVSDSEFVDSGQGLPGNVNTDHSSVYCNGDNVTYRNNRFRATNMVLGACFELHGSHAVAEGNVADMYERLCWLAADYEASEGQTVKGNIATNTRLGIGMGAPSFAINKVKIVDNTLAAKAGETYSGVSYFLFGNSVLSTDILEVRGNTLIGNNAANLRCCQMNKARIFRFEKNTVKSFNDATNGFGIVASGADLGGGIIADIVEINENTFQDVFKPISISVALAVGWLSACDNIITNSVATGAYAFNINLTGGGGIVARNLADANYPSIMRLQGTTTIRATQYDEMSADKGDTSITIEPLKDPFRILYNTPLTALRTVSLNVNNPIPGVGFEIVRTAAATGAFNLNVRDSGLNVLKSLTGPGQVARVQYDSAGVLRLIGYQAL